MYLCPKCGAKSTEKQFIEAFCIDCTVIRIEHPKKIEFDECNHCGRIRMKGKWQKANPNDIKCYIQNKCKGEFSNIEIKDNSLIFEIERAGNLLKIEKPIQIIYNKKICDECSKITGGYFEAIVQLRGDPKRVESNSKKIAELLNKRSFVSKIENLKEGIDIYCGETEQAFQVLSILKLKYKSSKKLHTAKQGKRRYRTSFVVRFE